MSVGRNSRMGREGRNYGLSTPSSRTFFNRLYLMPPALRGGLFGLPATTPYTALSSAGGVLHGGYGYVPTVGGQTGLPPGNGQIVARFTF